MNPLLNLVLCLVGLLLMVFAAMPAFTGKYAVTEASLETLRKGDVPEAVVEQIRTTLLGREFWYTFTLQTQLRETIGTEAALQYGPAVRAAASASLDAKDLVGVFAVFFLALGFWAWAFKQPLRRSR